jgi:hypothetical protein
MEVRVYPNITGKKDAPSQSLDEQPQNTPEVIVDELGYRRPKFLYNLGARKPAPGAAGYDLFMLQPRTLNPGECAWTET